MSLGSPCFNSKSQGDIGRVIELLVRLLRFSLDITPSTAASLLANCKARIDVVDVLCYDDSRGNHMNSKLRPKQQRFVDEYLLDLNGTQAAIRSGYARNGAEVTGSRLLRNPNVAEAIAEAMEERSKNTKIDAEWVLKQAVELHMRCMQQVRPALNPKTKKQLRDDDGNPLYTFNAGGAVRALELIGKHVDINAWKERIEHSSGQSFVERLQAGRRRISRLQTDDLDTVDITPAKLTTPH